jgi:hypothetical protein
MSKSKHGGMDVTEAQEAKQLRDENTRLRKLVADLCLDKKALQSVMRKNRSWILRMIVDPEKPTKPLCRKLLMKWFHNLVARRKILASLQRTTTTQQLELSRISL